MLRFGAARLGVVSCHLSVNADERYFQAGLLLDRVAAMDAARTRGRRRLQRQRPAGPRSGGSPPSCRTAWAVRPWGGEFTSRPGDPFQRIDAVFAGKDVEILGCGVPSHLPGVTEPDLRAATDHLPVLAALRVPAARQS